jgi:predicted membrane channel-forming protein YqfA (hemolysin III family)
MKPSSTRIAVLIIGSLLPWLLHGLGNDAGWFGGGILLGLGGMGIGLAAVIWVFAISILRIKRNQEDIRISYAFILASIGLLVLGATRLVAW